MQEHRAWTTRTYNHTHSYKWLTSSVRKLYKSQRIDATSEVDVSLVSGVTSSLLSNSLIVPIMLRCNHGSRSWHGHQETFPGISRLNSWFVIVCKDDDDAADGEAPSAKPPPPLYTVQFPGSRLIVREMRDVYTKASTLRAASHEHILPTVTRVFLNPCWTILGRVARFFLPRR